MTENKTEIIAPQAGLSKLPSSGLRVTRRAAKSGSGAWLCVALLFLLVMLVSNYTLLSGRATPIWDAANFFGPSFFLISDYIHAHRLVLWNPWTSGGTPDFAEPELGTASPILLLTAAAFKQPLPGFVAYWMLIWIGAGLGMLLLARHLRCPPWGGIIAALGFTASGFFTGHAQHTSSLYSIAFLPWICWRFDDALRTRRYWSAVQAGALYGLSALGGYPQFTILTAGFLGLWAIGRVFLCDESENPPTNDARPKERGVHSAIVSLVLVGAVGLLILCPPYLGFTTETRGYSDRVGERSRVESTSSNLLPAGAITTLASPYLSLLTYPGQPSRLGPASDVSMSNIYSGAAVMVLGLLALTRKSRWRWWFAFLALFFLCAALGNQLPLRGWIYDLAPPTRYFRNPSMFSGYTIFLLCVLAALGAHDLEEDDASRARTFLIVSAVAAASAALTFTVLVLHGPELPFDFEPPLIQLALTWFGVLICSALLRLRQTTARGCAQLLVAIAIFDAAITMVIMQPVMYSFSTRNWWQVMSDGHVSALELMSYGLDRQLHVAHGLETSPYPNNRNLALKIPVLASYTPFLNRFEGALEADPALPTFALGKDRMWFAQDAVQAAPTNEVFGRFVTALRKNHAPTLVVHTPDQMKAFSATTSASEAAADAHQSVSDFDGVAPASIAAINSVSYWPDSLEFRFEAPTAGWLMVTDRWAPGWKAEVNGKRVEVYGADFLFRAVRVDAGMNTVKVRYRPRAQLISIVVSWGTLLVFVMISLVRIARDKRGYTGLGPS